jgi:hypothetical protein
MSDIADILDRAADLIEPDGAWAQAERTRFSGSPYCIGSAALRIADDAEQDFGPVRDALFNALSVTTVVALIGWNDAPERTQAEAVAALRKAAAVARGDA